jgi:hypothetical protein
MRRITILILIAEATLVTASVAQVSPQLFRGQRVRVTAPDLGIRHQEAWFVALHGDTLILTADTAVMCPFSALERLEIRQAGKSLKWLGAGIGFVVGAATGALLGWASGDDKSGFFRWTAGEKAAMAAWALGVVGGVVGAIVGDRYKTVRWREFPLDRMRVSIVPQHRGFALAAAVRF